MICAGARPLPKPGQCPAAHNCQGGTSWAPSRAPAHLRRSQLRQTPTSTRFVLRPASAVPAQPGDSDLGAASGSLGGSVRTAETNGAPSDSVIASSSIAAGSGAGGASTNGGHSSFPVQTSSRASFQSVLKRGYLGEALFLVIGSALCGALAYWTIGTPLRRFNPYSFYLTLPQATGVQLGTPLRMKGVPMGTVLSARPTLDRVRVEVEVNEAKTIIPRGAKFELTQSGLIPAPSIDITTPEGVSAEVLAATVAARDAAARDAAAASTAAGKGARTGTAGRPTRSVATVRLASPRDVAACRLQGVLVCQGDEFDGAQGGSMDELMAHMLKTLRQGEAEAEGQGIRIVPGRGPLQG